MARFEIDAPTKKGQIIINRKTLLVSIVILLLFDLLYYFVFTLGAFRQIVFRLFHRPIQNQFASDPRYI